MRRGQEDTSISKEKLVQHIGTTRIYIETATKNLELMCEDFGITLTQAQMVYQRMDTIKFHEGHLKTQINIFHTLFLEEETP